MVTHLPLSLLGRAGLPVGIRAARFFIDDVGFLSQNRDR